MDFPEIREIDVNPFAMNPTGGIALDAEITLEQSPSLQRSPYEHLSIQPYPTQWVKTVELKNGQQVQLRPIRPEDEPLRRNWSKHLQGEPVLPLFRLRARHRSQNAGPLHAYRL
ncbi:MAG: hypothetical protein IPM36_20680 [Lewinellaceae bacterium]|nr:hypothetical protein [Lewinellaceae bacterium]